MPKNTKRKKNSKNNKCPTIVRALIQKEDGQEYALVTKALGNRNLLVYCYDGVERRARIRGRMRKNKRDWINIDDHILVSLRDFSEDTVDIIHSYNSDEVHRLKKMGELVDPKISLHENFINYEKEAESAFIFEDI